MATSIGITGQLGFIGSHLFSSLRVKDDIRIIPSNDDLFIHKDILCNFVKCCDVIIHLAGMSRGSDQQEIYDTNILLIRQLIEAMHEEHATPKVLFASTIHHDHETLYHKSKRDGAILFNKWAEETNSDFTTLILPNVYGPFGCPYFNSFVSTFCHKIANGESPEIIEDNPVQLIYINNLCNRIYNIINEEIKENIYYVPHDVEKSVSEILTLLKRFRNLYILGGTIPNFKNDFELFLFNTFISYIDIIVKGSS
ncbi:MAG TPA: NAD-dependent epimerase/dehydratase family protein [Victivallales bacterium]|nr:NAD-dependent epimerase/dehydratase family protein [Victivallales bacterium]